jgi:hypothetical protein
MKTKRPNGKAKEISKNGRFYLSKGVCLKIGTAIGTKKN